MKTIGAFHGHLFVAIVALFTAAGCGATASDYRETIRRVDRIAGEPELDEARKPDEVMAFYGVKPGDKVADIWAARGYYTAILSGIVGASGVVYTVNQSSRDEINQRWKSPKFAN